MDERQRLQYLDAMGVDTFVPRWVLPGARASVQCLLPDAQMPTPAAGPEPRPVARESEQAAVGSLVDRLLREQDSAPRPDASKASADEPAPAPAAGDPETEPAAFVLAFWRIHPQVMVVDSRQAKVLPTDALLRSICTALGFTEVLPPAEVQTWPLRGSGDKSWRAARETIQAFLEGRLLSDPVRYLVLMGDQAARAILPEDTGHPVVDRAARLPLDAFACEALVTPSLGALLLEPARKAALWRLLRPLRQLDHD